MEMIVFIEVLLLIVGGFSYLMYITNKEIHRRTWVEKSTGKRILVQRRLKTVIGPNFNCFYHDSILIKDIDSQGLYIMDESVFITHFMPIGEWEEKYGSKNR